ncbi:MAG: xanthine dehydrogenase family protein molybdopterin-binding subunit [Oscillospiraceae bacterium]|nr:xanthine dehydrogenase family protein molybdopterin-binding subunit [Oscillospiraceae bacterium]
MSNLPEYRYIGKTNVPRKDAADIVTGKTVFLDDFSVPKMLIGKVLKSPHAHANIVNIDAEKARNLPGVRAVLTWKEVDQSWKMGWPPQKPILGPKVFFVGDSVALVAAETEEIANAALDLIDVEYEVLPAVFDGLEAVKDGAPQLFPEFKNNIVTPGYFPIFQKDGPFWHLIKGNIDEGFEECAYIAEDTVAFAKKAAPLSPEPPGTIVQWEGGRNFRVWVTSQSSYICKIFNSFTIPDSDWTISTFNIGGSYGNKQSLNVQVSSAALLSMAANRPVKLYQTKVEQMVAYETRLGSQVHARIGMDRDGVVRAVKAKWTVDAGAHSNHTQGQVGVGIGEAQLVMAKCKHWDLDTELVVTNKCPAGIVRGYGGQELNSCLSLLMGRTMEAGGLDPVEVYKRNYACDGDELTWRDGRNWRIHSVNYVKAIEETAAKFEWDKKWKGWGVPTWKSPDGKKLRGVGCGIIGNCDVGEDSTEAYVRVSPDIAGEKAHVIMQCNVTESGMGQRSNLAKMVAEVLNVPYESVALTPPDTSINPTGFGLCGSRGTITYGRAVTSAAEDVKQQLFKLAGPHLGVPVEAMALENFCVVNRSRPGKFVSWKQLIPPDLTLTGYGAHLENFSTPNFCIVFVEAEVDTETGKTTVVNMTSGTDAGQVIDPAALEMQFHGGIGAASLDTALFEENIVDPVTGRQLTFNMLEYKWRPFNEFPEFKTVMLSSQFDTFKFKAVGVGEITGGAAASACMQAISNAIGTKVEEYPATPAVVLKALNKL